MPLGPGKYDTEATLVRERAKAAGVIVLVFGGDRGDGFSVQAPLPMQLKLPLLLRFMADEIEASTA